MAWLAGARIEPCMRRARRCQLQRVKIWLKIRLSPFFRGLCGKGASCNAVAGRSWLAAAVHVGIVEVVCFPMAWDAWGAGACHGSSSAASSCPPAVCICIWCGMDHVRCGMGALFTCSATGGGASAVFLSSVCLQGVRVACAIVCVQPVYPRFQAGLDMSAVPEVAAVQHYEQD